MPQNDLEKCPQSPKKFNFCNDHEIFGKLRMSSHDPEWIEERSFQSEC